MSSQTSNRPCKVTGSRQNEVESTRERFRGLASLSQGRLGTNEAQSPGNEKLYEEI